MSKATNNKIKLLNPANDWMESFLVGNGSIGGAIYGGAKKEQIDLSEITFFSGNASMDDNQEGANIAFYKMRDLVAKGEYAKAKEVAQGFIGKRNNYGTNLPVGKILIDFFGNLGSRESYFRQLDFIKGVAYIECEIDDKKICREAFISQDENKLYYSIKADDSKKLSFNISFCGHGENDSVNVDSGEYMFFASAREKVHSDGTTGTNLKGCVLIEETDGTISISGQGIEVSNASQTVISINMITDYKNDEFDEDVAFVKSKHSYEKAKEIHTQDFAQIMQRVSFSLDGADDTVEKMFQMGRYLLLSSSSKNALSPAHLQGVWNDNVACQIGWTCDMHLDINTQMNYWLSLEGNLFEANQPLFKWTEEVLIPSGRITANKSYGLNGWSADLVSNIWGFTAPYWHSNISPCPTSGIWMISQYWEYYRHSLDESFLKERAYPVLHEATEFFADYVFLDGAYYSAGPSISPENSFEIAGETHYFSNGSTYEIAMVRELFMQYLKACEILDAKDELYDKVNLIIDKLLPYRVSKDGTLAEWEHDYPASDNQHRHTSHLLGLYPYSQITPDETPRLAQAVQKSIKDKLTPYGNWEDTGWARSMLALYSARLRNGSDAYFHITEMKNALTSQSLLVMHPPTRGAASFKEVYELDGNTGFSMSIIEMLMQSHDDILRLLPTLPVKWESGHIKGILARGNITVDIFWKEKKLVEAVLVSPLSQTVMVEYKGQRQEVNITANEKFIVKF